MHDCDVFVEYTRPDTAKSNVLTALERNAHVVVGTSGLTEADFAEIDDLAQRRRRGVLACGNFALTVVLLQRFAKMAARLIPELESQAVAGLDLLVCDQLAGLGEAALDLRQEQQTFHHVFERRGVRQ